LAHTAQEIEQRLKDYITREFMYDKSEMALANDLPLIDAGIIDSLGIFTLIAFIETELKVKVKPDDVVIENFETIDTIKQLIMNRQG
jgi:acyl carrier protein